MESVVIIDTREQDLHILKNLEIRGIKCIRRKLDFGDYSFEIDGTSYEKEFVIERKGSLDELIGNFTKGRDRFRKEFERAGKCKVILMVESSMDKLINGEYRSNMSPASVIKYLNTWCHKFQLELVFVEKDKAAEYVRDRFNEFYSNEIKEA